MDGRLSGKGHDFYAQVVSRNMNLEWDLDGWNWDGDLFVANQMNHPPLLDCMTLFPVRSDIQPSPNSLLAEEPGLGNGKKSEFEFLNLNLGKQAYSTPEREEERSGKKVKILEGMTNRLVCQVEDCKVDLSNAKDYHRRHKVCDAHSKATTVIVGNVVQRFCQQCSRFHILEEFDDGKRSCRRRLAGHNKRRRKNGHHDMTINQSSFNDEGCSASNLLITLLKILSNMHSNISESTNDQNLLFLVLKNLAGVSSTINETNLLGILQGFQDMPNPVPSIELPGNVLNSNLNGVGSTVDFDTAAKFDNPANIPVIELVPRAIFTDNAKGENLLSKTVFPQKNFPEMGAGRVKLNRFDLNDVYNDAQNCLENVEKSSPHTRIQTSGNIDSTSASSGFSSGGEVQCRTDQIVFKLFGKDPNDFPLALRTKILDWLSHSPTDIESYIRPGCIILTIYLRMEKSKWEELYYNLGSSLSRLLDGSSDAFWKLGWIYTRVPKCVSFIYNGQVVLDTPLPFESHRRCQILSIKPIAVPLSKGTQFVVKGYNLAQPSTRLLCALQGSYLVEESCLDLMCDSDSSIEYDEFQSLSFPCFTPDIIGRGFIEVEDCGLSSSFFPFIVAEVDVCSEICTLESVIEMIQAPDSKNREPEMIEAAKNQCIDFIHEMGWLLNRNRSKFRLDSMDPNQNTFNFNRFKWLVEFSVNRDWCAVVKKLLCVIFSVTIDVGERVSIKLALSEMGLLHKAVQRNYRPMVEFLVKFNVSDQPKSDKKQDMDSRSFIFKPNVVGADGLTPLHIVASRDGMDGMLDALTNDPGKGGIEAWKSARDSNGLTPDDYARLKGRQSYIHLVQKKLNKNSGTPNDVVVDIGSLDWSGHKSSKVSIIFSDDEVKKACQVCKREMYYCKPKTLVGYRPGALSMISIAAVCVCVALLLRTIPTNWSQIGFGSI